MMPIDFDAAASEISGHRDACDVIKLDIAQAMAVLGVLQLALRHPAMQLGFAAGVATGVAKHLEEFIAEAGPNCAAIAAAGWNPEEDQ
jgi:hypothetical protein